MHICLKVTPQCKGENVAQNNLSRNNAEFWFGDVNMINIIMNALVLISKKKPKLSCIRLGDGQQMIGDGGLFPTLFCKSILVQP